MTLTEDHPTQARMLKTATSGVSADVPFESLKSQLTDLYAVPAKEEPRENHLSEPKSRAKGTEEAYGSYAQDVDKEDDEDGINESKVEYWVSKGSNGKGRHNHVGREPLHLG
jgi:hypothetical protein